jgi:signal peptide peptidase SppA
MKNLYRIQDALYNRVWAILPSTHASMVKQFESHIQGKLADFTIPDTDEDNEENDLEEASVNTNSNPTAVICVDGIIGKHLSMLETMCGGVDVDSIASQLKEAAADNNVQNIVLYFNTPGGTVTGVKELAQLISQIDAIKPVYGYTDTLCASAGYWLASQCRAFYCSPSADVGSVGVYCLLLDESRALDKEGFTVNAISAGKYKLSGASFRPLTDEERNMFQADVNKTYSEFKFSVSSKRTIADENMQGWVFDGETATTNGYADGNINSLDEFITLLTTEPTV